MKNIFFVLFKLFSFVLSLKFPSSWTDVVSGFVIFNRSGSEKNHSDPDPGVTCFEFESVSCCTLTQQMKKRKSTFLTLKTVTNSKIYRKERPVQTTTYWNPDIRQSG